MPDLIKYASDDALALFPDARRANLKALIERLTGSNDDMDVDDSTFTAPSLKIVHGIQLADPNAVPQRSEVGDIFASPMMVTMYRRSPSEDQPELGKALRFRPLYLTQSHSWYDKGAKQSVCSSPDGKFSPTRNMECKDCADKPGFENNKPKPCTQIYRLYVLLEDLSGVFAVELKSFNSAIATNIGQQTRALGGALSDNVWSLSTVIKDMGANKVPIFESTRQAKATPITAAERELCSALKDTFKDMHLKIAADARARAASFTAAQATTSPSIPPSQFLPATGDDDMSQM